MRSLGMWNSVGVTREAKMVMVIAVKKKKNCVGAESATVKIVNNLHIIVL